MCIRDRNCVAPGAIRIRTKEELIRDGKVQMVDFWDNLDNRIPIGRSGCPKDIGDAVVYLASEQASYITGFTLRVDGGLVLPGMPEIVDEKKENYWGGVRIFEE